MKKIQLLLFALFLTLFYHFKLYATDASYYTRLKAGIHFDSQVSGGSYSLGQLAAIIARTNLDVAIITDHDNMKVSYGLRPFQDVLKYSIEENSIAKYGVEKYLQEIDRLDNYYKNVILIAGIEAVPYYFWEGDPLYENLTLRNWHRHLLVFGMPDVEAYKNLPSIPNGLGYEVPTSHNIIKYFAKYLSHFFLILLVLIFFLISLFMIRRKRHPTERHRRKYRFSFLALILAVIFALILKSKFPFLPKKYNQYEGNQEPGPYQTLIDYVDQHGGMTFWAHPEVNHHETRKVNVPLLKQEISITTDAYPHLVSQTYNHNGFAIFWEGLKTVGKPGGLWDMTLREYCQGIRQKPVWAIGELDFEESNNLDLINETSTFLFVKEATRAGVLEAMRSGRMYATRGYLGDELLLNDFSVWDIYSEKAAFIGETLNLSPMAPVVIHINMHTVNRHQTHMVKLYRNEHLIRQINFSGSIDEWIEDNNAPDEMCYYRIYVGRSFTNLVTNPIFVKR